MAPKQTSPRKAGLHPRNRHRAGYDFAALVRASPALAPFVGPNAYGTTSIDFAHPAAVLALNRALLKSDYGVAHWDLPPGYLCPPIPGRADYLHHLADLLAEDSGAAIPRGPAVAILDLGVGANCIYPLLGVPEYGWRFVGTESDPIALRHARQIVARNPALAGLVELRAQASPTNVFRGVLAPGEQFTACICNPPFHASAAEAAAGTQRKLRNLGHARGREPVRNFGGQPAELWCRGGEAGFVRRMISESVLRPRACRWFTTLVSKSEHLPGIEHTLARLRATGVRVLPMAPGQKQSRIVAWTFRPRD
ncbi:MAG: 23S rRNA (adenine(1618)-N(6))-methyltransferase RlmF [Opitutae bacterium]|nr:23S rRNA (adenine(1618)-N(6))-methyltransferase RlmF [Opitutae bacterium]